MITLQTQNRFIAPQRAQRNTFGHGGDHHHHEGLAPKEVTKDAAKKVHQPHPPIGKYVQRMGYTGMAGLLLYAGFTVIKGPKPHRVAEQQVKAIVSKNIPDSTLDRLVEEQEEKNRKSADSARALIKRLGFEL